MRIIVHKCLVRLSIYISHNNNDVGSKFQRSVTKLTRRIENNSTTTCCHKLFYAPNTFLCFIVSLKHVIILVVHYKRLMHIKRSKNQL